VVHDHSTLDDVSLTLTLGSLKMMSCAMVWLRWWTCFPIDTIWWVEVFHDTWRGFSTLLAPLDDDMWPWEALFTFLRAWCHYTCDPMVVYLYLFSFYRLFEGSDPLVSWIIVTLLHLVDK
jgi:hypothetical protein